MAIFEAYFDESGIHDGAVVTMVAGALAKRSSWLSINRQWESILDKFGVTLFHATDLSNFRGEYKCWDEIKRRRFTTILLDIIIREKPTVFGIGVRNELYTKIKLDFQDVPLNSYQFCCEWCMSWVGRYVGSKRHVPPVNVAFEAGQKFTTATIKDTRRLLRSELGRERHGIAMVNTVVKSEATPLQVADLIAYELYKWHTSKRVQSSPHLRHPLMRLIVSLDEFVGGILSEHVIRSYLALTAAFIERQKGI